MKIFDKYFQPYVEYCLRTTLSEDELKETLAKECPATSDVLSWKAIKAAMCLSKTIVFSCDPDDSLHLHPIKAYRNTSRGDLFIRCEKAAGEETILHISIAQSGKYKWLLYAIGIFALFWGVAASFVIWWGIFLSVVFIGLVFIVLECCHAMAMDEVPQTGQEVVFDYQGKVVTDPANIGTQNYGSDPDTLSHVWNDVLPYYIWGNSSNDTTPFEDRVLGPEIGLSIRFSLEEIQKVFYNILKKSPQIYKLLENNDFYAIFY